jgi:hypothetical protein
MAAATPSRRYGPPLSIGVVIAIVLVWWWWPSVGRSADRLDVVVVGDTQVIDAREQIERRIREEGFSVESVITEPGGFCEGLDELAGLVDDESPTIVVLSPTEIGTGCTLADGVEVAGDATVVALVQPGIQDPGVRAEAEALELTVADPTRLLGDAAAVRLACQWWDDCEPDGQVAVRDDAGALTPAGGERVARVLVGVLP